MAAAMAAATGSKEGSAEAFGVAGVALEAGAAAGASDTAPAAADESEPPAGLLSSETTFESEKGELSVCSAMGTILGGQIRCPSLGVASDLSDLRPERTY